MVLLMIFAVLLRGKRGTRLENAGKMNRCGEARLLRYIGDAVIGFLQQILGRHDTDRVYIFHYTQARYTLKQSRKIRRTQIEISSDIG